MKSGRLCALKVPTGMFLNGTQGCYRLIDSIGYTIFGGPTLRANSVLKATKPRPGRPKSGFGEFKLQPGIPKPMLKASKGRFVDQQPWLGDLKPRPWKSPRNLKEPQPNS